MAPRKRLFSPSIELSALSSDIDLILLDSDGVELRKSDLVGAGVVELRRLELGHCTSVSARSGDELEGPVLFFLLQKRHA